MADQINEEQVKHVAALAKLEFSDQELPEFTKKLDNIMDLFAQLQKVDVDGVEPMVSPTDLVNVMRDDKAEHASARQIRKMLDNAPDAAAGLIKVPAIIDESGDGE